MNTRIALLVAATAGVAIEVVISTLSGTSEAWDSSAYWSAGIPAAVVVCGALGFAAPAHSNRYGVLLIASQFITTMIRNGSAGPLAGAGILVAAAVSVLCVVAGIVGATMARGSHHEPV